MNNLEQKFLNFLIKNNITNVKFEPFKIILDGSFNSQYATYRKWEYTPDFVFTYKGVIFVIEVKGNPAFYLNKSKTYRMVDKICAKKGWVYLGVKNKKVLGKDEWFLHNAKLRSSKTIKNIPKTFLERVNEICIYMGHQLEQTQN